MSLPTPVAFTESPLKAFAESPLKQRKAPFAAGEDLAIEARLYKVGFDPAANANVPGWPGEMPVEPSNGVYPASYRFGWSYLKLVEYQKTTDTLNNVYEYTRTQILDDFGVSVSDTTNDNHPGGYTRPYSVNRADTTIEKLTEEEIILESSFTDAFGSAIELRTTYSNGYTHARMMQNGLDLLTGKALGLDPEDYYANPQTGIIYPDKWWAQFPTSVQNNVRLGNTIGVSGWQTTIDGAHLIYDAAGWSSIAAAKYADLFTYSPATRPTYWILHLFLRNIPLTSNTWAPTNTTGYTSRAERRWNFDSLVEARCDGWLTPPTLAHKPLPRPGITWAVSPYQTQPPCS